MYVSFYLCDLGIWNTI